MVPGKFDGHPKVARRAIGLRELLANTERMAILETLARNRWNRRLSAGALGISRANLWQRMRKLDITFSELPRDQAGRKALQKVGA